MTNPIRSDAFALLTEYVQNVNLQKHMFAVEAAMRAYARLFHENEEWWGIAGLLHDFDYERFPNAADHPLRGAEILRSRGYDESFVHTILAHAPHTNEPRDTLAKKTLYAVDEVCGFIIAVALIRPNKSLAEVTVDSVQRKLKNKAFARQINREEIVQGAQELQIPLADHIQTVLTALQGISHDLDL